MSEDGHVLRGVRTGAPAHGGHVVARHEGRVVFVRHAAPGELVDVRLTDAGEGARFWRGDAITVHEPSRDRVPHVWPPAGPGGVGGAELGHLTLEAQRRWKATVIADTLRRIGHLEVPDVPVHAAPGEEARGGLGTRTRIELVVDAEGRPAMHRHRSHALVPVPDMPLAVEQIRSSGVLEESWPPGTRLDVVAAHDGLAVYVDGEPAPGRPGVRAGVVERVTVTDPAGASREYEFRVAGTGFWQVHPQAPRLLAERVLAAADLREGEHVLELYSGAGLLTLPLADAVGESGVVVAVEGAGDGARFARRNARAHPWVRLVEGDVDRLLARAADGDAPRGRGEGGGRGARVRSGRGGRTRADARTRAPGTRGLLADVRPDVVVLDPPRVGAGRGVVDALTALRPRRIVYVACDPAALARDAARAVARGYVLSDLQAYDLFPHTHHVEAIAVLDAPGDLRLAAEQGRPA